MVVLRERLGLRWIVTFSCINVPMINNDLKVRLFADVILWRYRLLFLLCLFFWASVCLSLKLDLFSSLLHIFMYILDMLPDLVPTALLALWWETLIISSPICIQLSEWGEGGVVVQLMLVPHSSAKETYSSSPSLISKVSTVKCHVMFSAVSQFTTSACSLFVFLLPSVAINQVPGHLFAACLDVTHSEVHSWS